MLTEYWIKKDGLEECPECGQIWIEGVEHYPDCRYFVFEDNLQEEDVPEELIFTHEG